ncbi:WXG100 family type VII secretion target [Amycolatopsis sp. CA-230715]|uniref:WXG100 family type VII secretion target n=1 Tax=Amycolatopsis sp. CA-230715 TaxID=2745196 RepID=UPI001C0272AE|nr:hypothetical protein [Amycolatopsis sp. CA-230715]QWF78125.1 hypothetical protein HUW46_01520 [Amycolatopsis sp. CA-230715]
MLSFPNSSAMDATASSGGPITILPEIVTGSPEQIAKHVGELLKKATEFTNLMTEFTKAAEQLEKAWSGAASESALKKISDSIAALTKIIGVVEKGAELLGVSGTLVRTAQEAYRSVVGAVNPTVASLMSNPWTYGAAVALSTATSASLRGFVEAVGALLKALGVVDLANQISQLATIIGEIDKLLGGGDKSGGATAPGAAAVGGTPVAAPQAPAPVASASGQHAFTDYVPPALATSSPNGQRPDSWIPVNPADGDVVVRTQRGDFSTVVEVPSGKDADIDLQFTVDGERFEQHIDVDADGSVSMDR